MTRATTLTERELDAVISVVEMTTEPMGGVRFADWGEANPEGMRALRRAERKLRLAIGVRA